MRFPRGYKPPAGMAVQSTDCWSGRRGGGVMRGAFGGGHGSDREDGEEWEGAVASTRRRQF